MGDMGRFQCTLLGTVEVTQSMRTLDSHQRLRMAKSCHIAIVNQTIEESDRSWLLPSVYYESKSVTMTMDSRHLTLYNGSELMCQHPVATISTMVTLEGSEGHLVYIGKCTKANNRRLAVVLSFPSLKDANSMVKKFENVKGQVSSGVNIAPPSGPPPLPTTPKPSPASQPPIPPKPKKPNGNKCTNDDEQGNYVNNDEEDKPEDVYEDEDFDEDEDHYVDEEDNYVNDDGTKKHSKLYENPESPRKVQPALPPRHKVDESNPQLLEQKMNKLQLDRSNYQLPETKKKPPESQGFFDKIFGAKKAKAKDVETNPQAIPNKPENKSPQVKGARALPGIPGEQVSNENPTANNSSRPNSDSSITSQKTDSDDDIYVNETFYQKIGLDSKDQERIYMKISPKKTRPISNGVEYLLDNEHKYITTVNKLADGKKLFPIEVQPNLGSVEKLPALHKDIYEALAASKESTLQTAEVFIHRKDKFNVYQNIIIKSIIVEKQLKNADANEMDKIKGMHEPLRQARKRLHFYFMHLEGLLSFASEEEKIKIQEAVDILKCCYRTADTGVLIKSIRKSPLQLMLYKPLHLHSLIHVSGPQITNKEYRVLLFEDILVIALPIEDDHEYQLDIRMEYVTTVNNHSTNPKILVVNADYGGVRKRESYNFRFSDETVKQAWQNEIMAIQKRYMEKIRDNAI